MGSLGVEELLDIKGPELDIKPSSVLDIISIFIFLNKEQNILNFEI